MVTESTNHNQIGTLQESSLHATLKAHYQMQGDQLETLVDGYVVDIVRPDLLIEIQTANFTAIRSKLRKLVKNHRLKLVYPIAQDKWIVRLETDDTIVSRRKSPKTGRPEDLFYELVRMPNLIAHPNFTLEVVLTQQEEFWINDGKGSWRRKRWSIGDRKLLEVIDTIEYTTPTDFLAAIPADLERPFTNRQLTKALHLRRGHAAKITYCLRKMGLLEITGKQGNAHLFAETN
ncbi:MAG: hypothetical protein JXB38_18180 [Anaerolineales bacterium]|nr:hypothetical protein [Anaerolineales bacterium]